MICKTTKINVEVCNMLTSGGATVVLTSKAPQRSPFANYTYLRPIRPPKPQPKLSVKIEVCTMQHHHRE